MGEPSPPHPVEELRRRARELHAAGRPADAIPLQVEAVNAAARAGQPHAEDYHRLGLMLFAARDFAAAATAFAAARRYQPDFPGATLNLGLSLVRSGRHAEALAELRRAAADHPDSLDLLDGLADVCGKLGDVAGAREYGEKSLLAKARQAHAPPPGFALPAGPPPAFRLDRPGENVISFSLFGSQPRYLRGAVKNVIVAAGLYPGWGCRVYCDDTVPAATRTALQQAGADVRLMPRPPRPADGLFWRFLVADDPAVTRFLVRDCDSVVNIRERRAVDEWLASDRHFHVLRDHTSHTDLMLAGLWGGVARLLPPLPTLLQGFSYNPVTESRTADQLFLGRVVWPLVRGSCLVHDAVYRVFDARPFPPGAELPPGRHVGDNDAAFLPNH